MIQKVILRNFQGHKKTILNLSSGVNAIVGSSDKGKSTIFRAIRWAATHRPQRNNYKSTWGGKTAVKLVTDLGSVTLVKDKRSHYEIGEQKFKALRTQVPDEVKQVLNLSDINFQRQHDAPFLLTASPGDVAVHFNKIANLDNIAESTKLIQTWTRNVEVQLSADKQLLKDQKHELESFRNLPSLEGELVSLEQQYQAERSKIRAVNRIQTLIQDIKEIDQDILHQRKLVQHKGTVVSILKLMRRNKDDRSNLYKLSNLVSQVQDIDKKSAELKLETELLHKKFHKNFPDVCPLCGARKEHSHGTN